MAKVLCPKCGEDITSTFEPKDIHVGIYNDTWYCDDCEETVSERELRDDAEADEGVDRRKRYD